MVAGIAKRSKLDHGNFMTMPQILAGPLTKCKRFDDLTPSTLYKHVYIHGFTIYKIFVIVLFTFCHCVGTNCKFHKLTRLIKLDPTVLYKTVLFHSMGHERLTEPVSL